MSLLSFKNVSIKAGDTLILENVQFKASAEKALAIVGKSGAGKTVLAEAIAAKRFHSGEIIFHPEIDPHKIVLVGQQQHFKNKSNLPGQFYYQQRYNSFDSEDACTVAEFLLEKNDDESDDYFVEAFGLADLLNKPVIQLSNGENKRLQLAKAMRKKASLLILDDPFVGIDLDGRKSLHQLICGLVNKGIRILLITSTGDLLFCIEEIVVLEGGKILPGSRDHLSIPKQKLLQGFNFPPNESPVKLDGPVVIMKNVNLQYGNRQILENINWTIKPGDCWQLAGHNGAGKSSLLSFITADNPQAYANEIYLFGKRRGSGESIWEIKKNIGYVSPELHLYFDQEISLAGCVASGLFDTIGLYKKITPGQQNLVNEWIDIFELDQKRNWLLKNLSVGEQRMALLARALIKSPALLVLDEPTQGLDEAQVEFFKKLVDDYCRQFKATLIYVTHISSHLPACVNKKLELSGGIAIISTK